MKHYVSNSLIIMSLVCFAGCNEESSTGSQVKSDPGVKSIAGSATSAEGAINSAEDSERPSLPEVPAKLQEQLRQVWRDEIVSLDNPSNPNWHAGLAMRLMSYEDPLAICVSVYHEGALGEQAKLDMFATLSTWASNYALPTEYQSLIGSGLDNASNRIRLLAQSIKPSIASDTDFQTVQSWRKRLEDTSSAQEVKQLLMQLQEDVESPYLIASHVWEVTSSTQLQERMIEGVPHIVEEDDVPWNTPGAAYQLLPRYVYWGARHANSQVRKASRQVIQRFTKLSEFHNDFLGWSEKVREQKRGQE